ncbi:MAG: hypothetical protein ACAH17_00240 [Candidatus Paceibacterota bacterium]
MSIPNIDTFEHDISEEIKNKEASIADIAAASGTIGNTEQTSGGSNLFFILGGLFIFAIICVLGVLLYFTAKNSSTPTQTATTTIPTTSTSLLYGLSPTLSDGISSHIQNVKKGDYGYTITLSSYTGAFAYMLKNESAYADEIALTFGEPRDTSTTTLPFMFTDVTLNNQNMRVGTSGSSTIVYAFINAQALIIASSTQGILSLASDILQ